MYGISYTQGTLLLFNPFYFEDHRSCAVVAAGDELIISFRPALHDRSSLQSRIYISADAVPGFHAEVAAVHGAETALVKDEFFTDLELCAGTDMLEVLCHIPSYSGW